MYEGFEEDYNDFYRENDIMDSELEEYFLDEDFEEEYYEHYKDPDSYYDEEW